MGHSIVRPSYRAHLAGDNGQPFFGFIFDASQQGRADADDLRGGSRSARRFIGWQTFFDFGDGEVKPNRKPTPGSRRRGSRYRSSPSRATTPRSRYRNGTCSGT
jgi:hypothetical protein